MIEKYFGTQADYAKKIMYCESGGRANATHLNNDGSTDYGLLQINSIHSRRVNGNLQSLLNPETNVQVAYQIWSEQGWKPWVCNGKIK